MVSSLLARAGATRPVALVAACTGRSSESTTRSPSFSGRPSESVLMFAPSEATRPVISWPATLPAIARPTRRVAAPDVQVGAADAAHAHLDDDTFRLDLGRRERLQLERLSGLSSGRQSILSARAVLLAVDETRPPTILATAMRRSSRTNPHHARRQPAPAGRSPRDDARGAARTMPARVCSPRAPARWPRSSASKSTTGLDVDRRRRDGQAELHDLRHRAPEPASRRAPSRPTLPWAGSKEVAAFPEFYASRRVRAERQRRGPRRPARLYGPRVLDQGHAQVQTDIDNLKAALAGRQVDGGIHSRPSRPPTSRHWHKNEYYKTDEEYLFAIADAMHEEYQAIVDAGFILQIDDPRLVDLLHRSARPERRRVPQVGRSCASRRSTTRCAASREDRVRFHTC